LKLLNHTLLYFSVALLLILGIWATIFYVNMLDEVYDSLDDGLDNYKLLIIEKAQQDSTVFYKTDFGESNYAIREVGPDMALRVKDVYKDTSMYMQNEEDFEPVRLLTTVFEGREGKYYELKVISSMVEEDDLIEDLVYSLFWLYITMMAGILIINNLLLRRTWRPFYRILEQLKKFRLGGKASVEIPRTRIKEFKDLNAAVNLLLENTLDTYNQQKQFIENASHELQTPLAISINKLELLVEKEGLSPESAESVGQVIQTLERLTRLNKSLLLLSRIENKQFPGTEDVNMNAVLHNVVDELSDYSAFKNIQISWAEEGPLICRMHRDLADILLTNLVKNAIAHNYPEGKIHILITSSSLCIQNTGKAETLDKEKIFRRFYKASSSHQSTGLGLAIVQAVATLYSLRLDYAYTGMHSICVYK
jgi:signal transduction histidine kinase